MATQSQKKSLLMLFVFCLIFFLGLASCQEKPSPKRVAEQFWQAIEDKNFEKAKQLATWDTVEYLKYFSGKRFQLQRYQCNEVNIVDSNHAEVATSIVLRTNTKGDIRLPLKTILVKSDGEFRVNLKQTSKKIISEVFNKAANQFGNIFQQGLNQLDKELSSSIQDLSNSLNEITNGLQGSIERGAGKLNDTLKQLEKNLQLPNDQHNSSDLLEDKQI